MTKLEQYGPWAVITGASSGIGRATAEHISAQGLDVVLVARSEATLDALADRLERTYGVKAHVVVADLSHNSGVTTVLDATAGLDVGLAVLAAGFGTTGSFAEASATAEREMIAVNVSAVGQLAQAFAARMSARRRGGIVLFGSILGWQGVAGQANYAATKAYIQSLAEGLHRELKPCGVDVLSVAPGPVHTGFAARAGLTMRSAADPDVVATAMWAALGRRITVVPGVRGKFLTSSLKMLPRQIRSIILARVMASMRR
ncbi:SDR family NAD(P)-dependent oxidoreductase [Mycobacterium sp. ML4]